MIRLIRQLEKFTAACFDNTFSVSVLMKLAINFTKMKFTEAFI